jgi:hypothetical protein
LAFIDINLNIYLVCKYSFNELGGRKTMTSASECIAKYLINFQATDVTVAQIFDKVFI